MVIGHHEEEDGPDEGSEQAYNQEQQLPRFNGNRVPGRADSDPVCDKTTKDLAPAVEREPYASPGALFFGGVPLRREESKAGWIVLASHHTA